jgi:hypothetical protein
MMNLRLIFGTFRLQAALGFSFHQMRFPCDAELTTSPAMAQVLNAPGSIRRHPNGISAGREAARAGAAASGIPTMATPRGRIIYPIRTFESKSNLKTRKYK